MPVVMGRSMSLNASSVTEMADRLESARLIKRVRPAYDRRLVILQATPRGRRLVQAAYGPIAGTIVPSRNFTVRLAPFEGVPGAAAKAEALDSAAIVVLTVGSDEPSAAQSPLNSRRLSNCFFISSIMATDACASRCCRL